MSAEDVKAVRSVFETDDLAPTLAILDPEVELRDFDIPDADVYRGHDGFLGWIANWTETFAESQLEVEQTLEAGDRVVVILRIKARGRASGIELERRDGMVWTMRAGKAVAIEYYGRPEEALRAAGLTAEPGR